MKILWEECAWEDYCDWQMKDKRIVKEEEAVAK